MQYVGRGQVNKQIAAAIGITEATVKLHRGRVMHKLKAESFAELIRLAEGFGLPEKR
jgi:FixJ family two-component response regulator